MSVEPCPECKEKDVRIQDRGGRIVVLCPTCGYSHSLKTTFPCVPEEIIEEWNAHCRVQNRIRGNRD